MCEAVLLDLKHGCGPACLGAAPPEEPHVFLLLGTRSPEDFTGSSGAFQSACGGSVHVLDSGSTAESLYRLKQTVDRLQLSSIRVLTTPQGRDVLLLYQHLLFTAVYTFDYVTCSSCTSPAHIDSPGGGGGGGVEEEVQEEVSVFVQQLPALKGEIRVLKSTLIPDCFGHGFTTRRGGVSSIPPLSSLNLFSSSRRRDPVAVVTENRRRLAVHAGFHPRPLRLVKVNHGSDVWVVGSSEPESYDAMVTDQPGVVLAAPGADCMPVLFADPVSKVIGAAHAGWRGTLMGVAAATVDAMVKGFGCRVSDIVVAVGPSVGACCYTMERETALGFQRVHPDCVTNPESARPHVDIRLANRLIKISSCWEGGRNEQFRCRR
ncbi:laccase domain-containing protein 1 isoform X2 [Perca flavescens]|uniref:laccase domain-containing protein 1 isoform X2 n=1 Tax=Perca flavescens TaxID=8167 RepID=UPI00106E84B6|nr:laccase domain-containing protein 1 isoform X2 [Perca flavescens]